MDMEMDGPVARDPGAQQTPPPGSWLTGLDTRRAALEERHGPWTPMTLGEALDRAAATQPHRTYVIGERTSYTYAQMAAWSVRLATGFVDAGVEPGDRVAVVLPNGPEAVAVRFALARAGAVAVPVSFRLHARELAQILAQSEAAALVTMEMFREIDALDNLDRIVPEWDAAYARGHAAGGATLPALRLVVTVPAEGTPPQRPAVPTLEALEDLARGGTAGGVQIDPALAERAAAATPRDTATIFYTSGTTGVPKGVVSTHEMELRSAYGSAYTRAFEDGRRIMFALPLNHVFAYIEGMLAALFVEGAIVVQSVFDPVASLEAIERHDVGEALFVPTMSLAVVDAARRTQASGRSYDLSSLHSVMSAAQSAPARLWMDLADVLGVEQCVTAYGMTETSAATTYTEPGGPVDDLVDTVGRPKPGGAAGDPGLDGALCEYKTIDPITCTDLGPGEEGELAARGPIVCRGYFRQAEATADAVLPGGWLRSGDLGFLRDDGALVLTGRSKDIYKCGGELVMPTEVEARLTSRPDIAQAYVIGVPDPRMGEVGCAWVVPADGAAIDTAELLGWCRTELARFKVPAYAIVTPASELPLTPSGKVQKFKLAERAIAQLGI